MTGTSKKKTSGKAGEIIGIIPARLASTRLPRKVLLAETGKPLVQHVYEAAKRCAKLDRVVIATDAQEVVDAVQGFGGEAVLTSPDCASGTDRVAEAARHFPKARLVLNVQGDEPEMDPAPLTALVEGMLRRKDSVMGTVASPWPEGVPLEAPGFVKVVTDTKGDALYFSRSPIPFYRDDDAPPHAKRKDGAPRYLKHLGLYGFTPDFLQTYAGLAPTPLERAESLEQLRALENGHRIAVFLAEYRGQEVNTPEDYAAFVKRYRASSR
jgi:3-deoxy-manno-octulosonate cytidylyltransferase (CMP-KDO synthetase)